jgi:hypothetical protein
MCAGTLIVKLLAKDMEAYTLPAPGWREDYRDILCQQCYKLRRTDVYPKPVDICLLEIPPGTSYSGVFWAGVAVIHQSLLEFLEPYMRDFVLGRCYWKDGSAINEYVSVYFRHCIRTRGDRTTEYYVCGECGFVGAGSDNPYVLRGDLPAADVFAEATNSIYLSEDLGRRFSWRTFSDLKPWTIPVRDSPLPDDPLFLESHDPEKVIAFPCRGNAYELMHRDNPLVPLRRREMWQRGVL